jgi:SWI/SNF-related matrix-associated actin-dependent regulator 1 of chromatin subfamily A
MDDLIDKGYIDDTPDPDDRYESDVYIKDGLIHIEWWTDDSDHFYKLLEYVKDLPDRRFVKTPTKHWVIPAKPYHAAEVIRMLEPLGFHFHKPVKKLASKVEKLLNIDRTTSERQIFGVENNLPLRDYQVAAVEFAHATKGRCILGDDVGVGKTVESLAYAWEVKKDIRYGLVVCPATVLYKWGEEVEAWTGWKSQVISATSDPIDLSVQIHCMTYDVMRRKLPELLDVSYHLLVLDEFHYIKNNKAMRTRAVKQLAMGVPYILGLSGTPLLNRPIEMFNMLHMLDKKAWPNWYQYGHKYCGGPSMYGMFQSSSNEEELKGRLKTIMIRRMKREVRSDMPPMQRTIIPVKVDLVSYSQIANNVETAILAMSPENKGYWVNVLDKMSLLRKAIGTAKMPVAAAWAKDFLETTDQKLLIYAHHLDVVKYLEEALKAYGVTTITGSTPKKQRYDNAKAFQSDATPRVILITSAGGVGIDLFGIGDIEASNILFAEREWTPATEEQAEGRLDREGQTLPVNAWYLAANGTIDTKIAELIDKKRGVIEQIVGGKKVPTVVADLVQEWREAA